jgi:tetratricopeptide (TPR) repeat protein
VWQFNIFAQPFAKTRDDRLSVGYIPVTAPELLDKLSGERTMARRVFKALAANLCLSVWAANLANAQGVAEMGAVYGMPKAHPSSSVSGAVNRVYGAAAGALGSATDTSAPPPDSSDGAPLTPAANFQRYGKQANDAYVQAQKAEQAGKITEAQRYYYQALSIRQNLWGVGDPGSLAILLKLGDINVKRKNYDYAETCYKQYLGGLAKASGPGTYESAVALNKLAQLYALKEQYDEAANTLRNILALDERKFGVDSNEYMAGRVNLVDTLMKAKEFPEGEDLSKEGMTALSKKNDEHSQAYLHLLNTYAICARGLHHDDAAKQAEDKVAALKQELGTTTPAPSAAPDTQPKADDKTAPSDANAPGADSKAAPSTTPEPASKDLAPTKTDSK